MRPLKTFKKNKSHVIYISNAMSTQTKLAQTKFAQTKLALSGGFNVTKDDATKNKILLNETQNPRATWDTPHLREMAKKQDSQESNFLRKSPSLQDDFLSQDLREWEF